MNKKYQLLIFDMGGTLLRNIKLYDNIKCNFLYHAVKEEITEKHIQKFESYFNELRENIRSQEKRIFEFTICGILRSACIRFGLTPNISYEEMEKYLVIENIRFEMIPNSMKLFQYINRSKYKVCVLSNSELTSTTLRYILRKTIPNWSCDEVFSSADLVYRKPSQQIFEIVLNKYSMMPRNCCMIGNHLSDVVPSSEMGIDSFLLKIDDSQQDETSLYTTIPDLDALIPYLEKVN